MAKQKVEVEIGIGIGSYEICGDAKWKCTEHPLDSSPGFIEFRVPIKCKKEYREPVLPFDAGKPCEFSDDGKTWVMDNLGWWNPTSGWRSLDDHGEYWNHCRIEKEST